jgi:hypothetical protein
MSTCLAPALSNSSLKVRAVAVVVTTSSISAIFAAWIVNEFAGFMLNDWRKFFNRCARLNPFCEW